MILTRVSLTGFRNYTKKSFPFNPGVTLVLGPNASGKTNILEAISALSAGKSFRADRDAEMIRWGSELARVQGTADDTVLELVITTGQVGGRTVPGKKYLVNGVSRRPADFAGQLRTVLFWPEDMELVTDSPGLRRRYMDRVLSQVDREYRRNLLSYERGIRQRNRLLELINEGKSSRTQLIFWNQLLIKSGGYITDARGNFLEYVSRQVIPGMTLRISYDKSVISETRLEEYRDEEVAAKATLVGPHRDDCIFQMRHSDNTDWLDLSRFGSRGEQRMGVLWLKLAEVAFITERAGNKPLLLLDDILSELDTAHRDLVIELIRQHQVIVTSAEEDAAEVLQKHRIPYDTVRLPADDRSGAGAVK
ncbi:hypothetical protein A2Z33_03365 [Candidatus Gottesmanbacteria bacterium RBG_16_52_11]|uniref:DNA replication and repair protein RecF n=1 Tax=Candidatus Gottesmanbacteria bacterium RBG_16_52_11 TaxID=1798374 RepID=A0A1F5YVD6_9BACT|nr:MAG: hypothetical protein A2Z33_03365 [Candidatus Gottesmanbacteria bacterium RBG_16_52_11]